MKNHLNTAVRVLAAVAAMTVRSVSMILKHLVESARV